MRSHLGGWVFAALTVIALFAGQATPALLCAIATAITWKRRPHR